MELPIWFTTCLCKNCLSALWKKVLWWIKAFDLHLILSYHQEIKNDCIQYCSNFLSGVKHSQDKKEV